MHADSSEVDDVELAVRDHLVGDLDEETSHTLGGVVVSGDRMDDLDLVHESGEGFLDGVGVAFVQGLNVLLEVLELLHVLLGLNEGLSHALLVASPSLELQVDLVLVLATSLGVASGGSLEDFLNSAAVLAAELLGQAGESAHAHLPVVDLLAGTGVLVVLLLGVSLLKGGLDLVGPLFEGLKEVADHLGVDVLGGVDGLRFLALPLLVEGVEHDVALERLESLDELLSELVEGLAELFLLFGFTMSPVTDFELVDQGFVNVVDDSVQRSDRVLRDLSEEDLVVVLAGRADSLARRAAADEVHSDTSELYVLT